MRIAILGIGGVGGFIGGKLAATYDLNSEHPIIFVARGEHGAMLAKRGLKMIEPTGEKVVRPAAVVSSASELGHVDLLICCVKGYNLDVMSEYRTSLHEKSIVLPLLNGVSASDQIQKMLPDARVWGGCIYVFSKITAPGAVTITHQTNPVYFGSFDGLDEEAETVAALMRAAGINAIVPPSILRAMWVKFVMISALATLTSVTNLSVGEIFSDAKQLARLMALSTEVRAVAMAKGVDLGSEIGETILKTYRSLPGEVTSSMQIDYQQGRKTEVDMLTGYVVKAGRELGVATPTYDDMLRVLLARQADPVG